MDKNPISLYCVCTTKKPTLAWTCKNTYKIQASAVPSFDGTNKRTALVVRLTLNYIREVKDANNATVNYFNQDVLEFWRLYLNAGTGAYESIVDCWGDEFDYNSTKACHLDGDIVAALELKVLTQSDGAKVDIPAFHRPKGPGNSSTKSKNNIRRNNKDRTDDLDQEGNPIPVKDTYPSTVLTDMWNNAKPLAGGGGAISITWQPKPKHCGDEGLRSVPVNVTNPVVALVDPGTTAKNLRAIATQKEKATDDNTKSERGFRIPCGLHRPCQGRSG